MALPDKFNLDELLKPISEENPVGNNVRDDPSPTSVYRKIKQARRAARAAERYYMFPREGGDSSNSPPNPKEHWKTVVSIAPEILSIHCKDIEVSSWFIEAMTRTQGFDGLLFSFKLTNKLIETYWDKIYPLPDEDGMLTRVAALAGLNGEGSEGVLISPIRNIPLTEGNHATGPFSFFRYKQALDTQKITDIKVREEKSSKLNFNIDDIKKAVSQTSEGFYLNLRDNIVNCISEYKEISKRLDELCGSSIAPPTSNIINVLERCLGAVNHLAKDKLPVEAIEIATDTDTNINESSNTQKSSATVNTRDAAFKQLHEISDFFLRTEPHSPISYVLAKAVKWGNMPLDELIGELIPDNSSREYFSSLTGVKISDES
ncbi:MAG: type VI secretion system protein TssA [Thiohalomonadales bacterium]